MQTMKALIRRNIHRAGLSLPFLDPKARDLITLIPALLSEGRPAIGTYGRPSCCRSEFDCLRKALGERPDIIIGRLPDRVMLESVIVLVRPCLASKHHSSVTAVLMARKDAPRQEIRAKADALSRLFGKSGIPFSALIHTGELPQLLIYEIMRTGIVLGGKHPVTRKNSDPDRCIYIGNLPGTITDAGRHASMEWNPFRHFLESRQDEFIGRGDFPSALNVPGANPFILPYLHILHRDEERFDTEYIDKMRMSILSLYSGFPPVKEALKEFREAWKAESGYPSVSGLGFIDAMRLRTWLVPLEKDELPIFSWPPQPHLGLDRLDLVRDGGLWSTGESTGLRHIHAWVVLVWAAVAGLIGKNTRIAAPKGLMLKPDCRSLLLGSIDALMDGVEILVPEDHTQGSIRMKDGRFFYSSNPFALLGQGRKHVAELFVAVKKKALLDDINLSDTNKSNQ